MNQTNTLEPSQACNLNHARAETSLPVSQRDRKAILALGLSCTAGGLEGRWGRAGHRHLTSFAALGSFIGKSWRWLVYPHNLQAQGVHIQIQALMNAINKPAPRYSDKTTALIPALLLVPLLVVRAPPAWRHQGCQHESPVVPYQSTELWPGGRAE